MGKLYNVYEFKIDKHIIESVKVKNDVISIYIQYNNTSSMQCFYLINEKKFYLLNNKLTKRQSSILENKLINIYELH